MTDTIVTGVCKFNQGVEPGEGARLREGWRNIRTQGTISDRAAAEGGAGGTNLPELKTNEL